MEFNMQKVRDQIEVLDSVMDLNAAEYSLDNAIFYVSDYDTGGSIRDCIISVKADISAIRDNLTKDCEHALSIRRADENSTWECAVCLADVAGPDLPTSPTTGNTPNTIGCHKVPREDRYGYTIDYINYFDTRDEAIRAWLEFCDRNTSGMINRAQLTK